MALTYGKIVGKLVTVRGDQADTDRLPDTVGATAITPTFAPQRTAFAELDLGALVSSVPVSATVAADGTLTDEQGQPGVWLVTGTYKVGLQGHHPDLTVVVTEAHTDAAPLDLVSAVSYTPPPGTTVQTVVVPAGAAEGQVLAWVGGTLTWVDPAAGGTAELTSYATQVESLADYPTAFPTTPTDIATSTATGQSLITATDAAAARAAIGAGTSGLALGTTSSTAKAGDYQPTAANISDATTTGRDVLTAATATAARSAIGAPGAAEVPQVGLWNSTARTWSTPTAGATVVHWYATNDSTFDPATEAPVKISDYDVVFVVEQPPA